MDTEEVPDSAALSGSPLHDDFEWGLIRKFDGLWLYEDDPDLPYRVDQLFRLFYRARELFYEVGPHSPFLWSDEPSPFLWSDEPSPFLWSDEPSPFLWSDEPSTLHLSGSRDIYVRAYSIYEHERDEQPDSLIERARQICALGGKDESGDAEFSDGQIFTALALREIASAIDAICDVCVIFQAEAKPFIAPLSALRESFPNDYWRQAGELRTRNWREEREKFIEAYEHKARAETMMLLAVIASEGVLPHNVMGFASELRQGARKQGEEKFTKARKGKQAEHTRAIEKLACEWQLFTPATFRKKLHGLMVDGKFHCSATGGTLSKVADEKEELRYHSKEGRSSLISPDALRKALFRLKVKQ